MQEHSHHAQAKSEWFSSKIFCNRASLFNGSMFKSHLATQRTLVQPLVWAHAAEQLSLRDATPEACVP